MRRGRVLAAPCRPLPQEAPVSPGGFRGLGRCFPSSPRPPWRFSFAALRVRCSQGGEGGTQSRPFFLTGFAAGRAAVRGPRWSAGGERRPDPGQLPTPFPCGPRPPSPIWERPEPPALRLAFLGGCLLQGRKAFPHYPKLVLDPRRRKGCSGPDLKLWSLFQKLFGR